MLYITSQILTLSAKRLKEFCGVPPNCKARPLLASHSDGFILPSNQSSLQQTSSPLHFNSTSTKLGPNVNIYEFSSLIDIHASIQLPN